MRKYLLFFILFWIGFSGFKSNKIIKKALPITKPAQDTLTWKRLGQIKYVKKQHPDYGPVDYPIVPAEIKKHHKKRIVLSGFIVPIDNVNYAVSKNVFAACFFCGKAGPETIAGLKFRESKLKLRTDQYVTLSGFLKINETDVNNWMYNLEDVIILKGN